MTTKQIHKPEPIKPIETLTAANQLEDQLTPIAHASLNGVTGGSAYADEMVNLVRRVQVGTVDPKQVSRGDVIGGTVKIGSDYFPKAHLEGAQWLQKSGGLARPRETRR